MTEQLQEKKLTISGNAISTILQLLALAMATGILAQKVENLRDTVVDVRADVRDVQRDVNTLKVDYNGRLSVAEDRLNINTPRRAQ